MVPNRWENAAGYEDRAAHVDSWTYTITGPSAPVATTCASTGTPIRTTGPRPPCRTAAETWDERRIVDPSFLELVRLGIKRPDDPHIRSSLPVIDRLLEVHTPNGPYWHRYDQRLRRVPDGRPWNLAGKGRAWPLLTGERGEYELAAGHPARALALLTTLARAGDSSLLLPEQVGDVPGDPTRWGFRLAWGIAQGSPVETPSIVACRYVRACG